MDSIYNTFVPKGFSTVNAYIFAENPLELINFYKAAFFATEIGRTERDGIILNCILQIGESCFMVSQARDEFLGMRSSFYLFTKDVDQLHTNAMKHGAQLVMNPADMDYNDRQSGVIDPSGNYWWISKRLIKEDY